jgi:hypothetical protein
MLIMNDRLNKFAQQIMNLDANVPGTGISSAGMAGAASPRQHALDDLKRKTLEFVAEHRKRNPDKSKLNELAGEIEGNLLGINSLQVIDDNQLDKIVNDLHLLKS